MRDLRWGRCGWNKQRDRPWVWLVSRDAVSGTGRVAGPVGVHLRGPIGGSGGSSACLGEGGSRVMSGGIPAGVRLRSSFAAQAGRVGGLEVCKPSFQAPAGMERICGGSYCVSLREALLGLPGPFPPHSAGQQSHQCAVFLTRERRWRGVSYQLCPRFFLLSRDGSTDTSSQTCSARHTGTVSDPADWRGCFRGQTAWWAPFEAAGSDWGPAVQAGRRLA